MRENPSITIDIPASEWLTANGRYHWAVKAKRTKALRHRAHMLARSQGLTVPTPCFVVVEVGYPRGGTADPDNAQPAWKACCDGIVDSGALPGDDSEHIIATSYMRGTKTGRKGMYRLTARFVSQHVPF